jgi:predicted Zn finger-like uncharacterized protein
MQAEPRQTVIVRCPECRAKYELNAPQALDPKMRVRCPDCKAVFSIRGRDARPGEDEVGDEIQDERVVRAPRPRITDPTLARRLARAMISEIVLNRREERGVALEEDRVLRRFGPALASAYDIYRSKVSPDLSAAPRIFREAVNDVLGEGRTIL